MCLLFVFFAVVINFEWLGFILLCADVLENPFSIQQGMFILVGFILINLIDYPFSLSAKRGECSFAVMWEERLHFLWYQPFF